MTAAKALSVILRHINFMALLQVLGNGSFLYKTGITEEDAYTGVVAPFLSRNNFSSGSILYEVHTRATSKFIFSIVDSIINKHHKNHIFNGSWLLVASWQNVKPYGETCRVSILQIVNEIFILFLQSNTFQGILVTDFTTSSFAIFTYRCGDLGLSDPGQIGFGFNNTNNIFDVTHGATYREHPHFVSCLNIPRSPWVNIVYEITRSGIENSIFSLYVSFRSPSYEEKH